jgi:hypothetical protein
MCPTKEGNPSQAWCHTYKPSTQEAEASWHYYITTTLMSHKDVMLSEVSQSQKNKYYNSTNMCVYSPRNHEPGPVAQTCNSSSFGDGYRRIMIWGQSRKNSKTLSQSTSQAWWFMPVILSVQRRREEVCGLRLTPGASARQTLPKKQLKQKWLEGMSQIEEDLLSKLKDLNPNPSTTKKNYGNRK